MYFFNFYAMYNVCYIIDYYVYELYIYIYKYIYIAVHTWAYYRDIQL